MTLRNLIAILYRLERRRARRRALRSALAVRLIDHETGLPKKWPGREGQA